MSSVNVKRNIVLRSVVTQSLRDELSEQLQNAAEELQRQMQQIDTQTRAYVTDLQRTNLQQAMAVRKQIEAEKSRLQEQHDALLERRAQVQELEDGSEIVRGTLESFVDLKVGDNLSEVLGGLEILSKDDEVIEIRQRDLSEMAEESIEQIIHDARTRSDG